MILSLFLEFDCVWLCLAVIPYKIQIVFSIRQLHFSGIFQYSTYSACTFWLIFHWLKSVTCKSNAKQKLCFIVSLYAVYNIFLKPMWVCLFFLSLCSVATFKFSIAHPIAILLLYIQHFALLAYCRLFNARAIVMICSSICRTFLSKCHVYATYTYDWQSMSIRITHDAEMHQVEGRKFKWKLAHYIYIKRTLQNMSLKPLILWYA